MGEEPKGVEGLRVLVHELLQRNQQLQTALDSRILIEQAKGILAERLRMNVGDAFRVLRRAARNSRVRIRDLAADVVARPETPDAVLDAARAIEPGSILGDAEDAERSDMRIAENEALFRRVNEQLMAAEEPIQPDERLLFMCECGDPGCTDFVGMTAEEYEAIRHDPRWFIVLPGHEELWVERVLDRRNGYVVVEKELPAAALAEDLDPRAQG